MSVRGLAASLAAMVGLALVLATAPAIAAPARASLPVIERQVMCPVCGVPLELADSPQAIREKDFIAALIAQGRDTSQIKRALVATYGPAVLALPPQHGFDLTVYLVPLGVAIAVAALLAVLVPRWRRRAPALSGASTARGLSASDAARLDEDLRRFDV